MRSFISAVALATVALAGAACSRSNTRTQSAVTVPESFTRTPTAGRTGFAPVARGTIRLGEVETAGAMPEAAPTEAPTGVGGGPPATTGTGTAQTSVGAMSPTTVTGADSPLDTATTAPPVAGQPANPTMTGSAGAPGGPNAHGGVSGHPASR